MSDIVHLAAEPILAFVGGVPAGLREQMTNAEGADPESTMTRSAQSLF